MILVDEVFTYSITEDEEVVLHVYVSAVVKPPEPPVRPHFNTPGEPGVGPEINIQCMYPVAIEIKHGKREYMFPIAKRIDVSGLIPDYIQQEWEDTLIDMALEAGTHDSCSDV